MHVPRPLRRAHAHHRPLRVLSPAASSLVRDLPARLVPDLLGVEQHAVEVEDHRLDHVYAWRRCDEGFSAWTADGRDDVADEERVVAGRMLGREAAFDPPERPLQKRRAELAGRAFRFPARG